MPVGDRRGTTIVQRRLYGVREQLLAKILDWKDWGSRPMEVTASSMGGCSCHRCCGGAIVLIAGNAGRKSGFALVRASVAPAPLQSRILQWNQ